VQSRRIKLELTYQYFPYQLDARYVNQRCLDQSSYRERIYGSEYLSFIHASLCSTLLARDAFDIFLGLTTTLQDPYGQLCQGCDKLGQGLLIEEEGAREQGVERVLKDLEISRHHGLR